jgi:hypothetical protein
VATVKEVHAKLAELIANNRGDEDLWVDPPMAAGEPATLYSGEDEDEGEIAQLDVN